MTLRVLLAVPAVLALAAGCSAVDDGAEPDTRVSGEAAPDDARVSGESAPDDARDRPPPLHPRVDELEAATVRLVRRDGATVEIVVRVAADEEARRRGLMEVTELPEGTGMLFVYEREREGGFWMKDTLVPLDIAFAGGDGTIRAVETMPLCTEDPCPVHDPGVAYRFALEVPAGHLEQVGVEVGDRLLWDGYGGEPPQ